MRSWNRKREGLPFHLFLGPLFALICLTCLPILAQAADELEGEWQGSATLPGGEALSIVLKLEQPTADQWSGEIQAVADGESLPLDGLSISGTAVSFRFQIAGMERPAVFSGNYSAWNDVLRGVMIYGGESLMIRLDRVGLAPGAEITMTAPGDTAGLAAEEVFERIRHTTHFGLVARWNLWKPVYVIRENTRNINDIATDEGALDVSFRWYAMDDLALFIRYVDGGLGFHSNPKNLGLFNFTGLEYIDINGYEFGMNVYIGDILTPDSNYNPYITASLGKMDWQLGVNGPDSEPYTILEVPVEGNDLAVGGGLGCEYMFGDHYALEFEWMWRYVFTEDDTKWLDTRNQWTNTHFWALSLGLVRNF